MNDLLLAGASWLHLLATVVFIGFYVLSGLIISPAAAQTSVKNRGSLIVALYGKARPFVVGALLVFIVTGAYMTLVNPQYTGLMKFDNAWSWLIVGKHVVVVLLIGVGLFLQRVPVEKMAAAIDAGDERSIVLLAGRVRTLELLAALLGVIILLLTALAAGSVA
jgi:uncharacterized membrane protein